MPRRSGTHPEVQEVLHRHGYEDEPVWATKLSGLDGSDVGRGRIAMMAAYLAVVWTRMGSPAAQELAAKMVRRGLTKDAAVELGEIVRAAVDRGGKLKPPQAQPPGAEETQDITEQQKELVSRLVREQLQKELKGQLEAAQAAKSGDSRGAKRRRRSRRGR